MQIPPITTRTTLSHRQTFIIMLKPVSVELFDHVCVSKLDTFSLILSKDALQEKYNQEGIFPGQKFIPPRRPWTLLNFLFWSTILLSPLFKFGFGIFASGSPLLILAFLGFVGAGKKREGA